MITAPARSLEMEKPFGTPSARTQVFGLDSLAHSSGTYIKSSHNAETILFTTDPHCDNLNLLTEEQPSLPSQARVPSEAPAFDRMRRSLE